MKHDSPAIRRQRGTTLIELIMVMVIASVLACLSLPPLRGMLARQRIQTAQMDLINGLQNARADAIGRNVRIVFCPTRDGLECSAESRWDAGWLIGADRNYDNQPDEKPLYVHLHEARSLAIRSSAGRHAVIFQPDGMASGSNVAISICDPGIHDQVLSVVVSNAGRIRSADANAAQLASCISG